jgi:uncharacterized membrane protein
MWSVLFTHLFFHPWFSVWVGATVGIMVMAVMVTEAITAIEDQTLRAFHLRTLKSRTMPPNIGSTSVDV